MKILTRNYAKQWSHIFQGTQKQHVNLESVSSKNIFQKWRQKSICFLNKEKLSEIITRRPILREYLKEVLQTKGKYYQLEI